MSEFSQAVLALAVYRLIPILLALTFASLGFYLLRQAFSTWSRVDFQTRGIVCAAYGLTIFGILFAGFGVCVIKKNLGWMEHDISRIYALVPPPLDQHILAIIKQASDGGNLNELQRDILKQWLTQEIEKERVRRLQKTPQPPQPPPNPGAKQ